MNKEFSSDTSQPRFHVIDGPSELHAITFDGCADAYLWSFDSEQRAKNLCSCLNRLVAPLMNPSPERRGSDSLTFTAKEAYALVQMFDGPRDESEITVQQGNGEHHSGPGLYAWATEYPEEGSICLSDGPAPDAPPAPAETLPCRVTCEGGGSFGAGVRISTLLDYLARRHVYNAEGHNRSGGKAEALFEAECADTARMAAVDMDLRAAAQAVVDECTRRCALPPDQRRLPMLDVQVLREVLAQSETPPRSSGGFGVATADPAQKPLAMQTPDGSLPRFDPDKPRRKLLVTVEVPEDWEQRMDMQWCLEREIHADRWSWNFPEPKFPVAPMADALLALDRIATRVAEAPDGYLECVNIARRVLREFPIDAYGDVMRRWKEEAQQESRVSGG